MKYNFPAESDFDLDQLFLTTERFKEYSYSPYSKFRVACSIIATLQTKEKILVMGANVENASYGLTICAERVALVELNQYKPEKIDLIVLAADGDGDTYPCGACRQFISEFAAGTTPVYVGANGKRNSKPQFVNDLLPNGFNLKKH